MTVAIEPYITVKVERAATKGLGLHQANAAASDYFYPEHLFEMVQADLVEDRPWRSHRSYWSGSVTFRVLPPAWWDSYVDYAKTY